MSWDFSLEQICTHEVKFESVSLVAGSLTDIQFPKPPVNQNVSLYVDNIQIPQSGLYSVPSIVFFNEGPYRIVSGQSDLLNVKIGSDATQTVYLPPGPSVSADQIAKALSTQILELSFSVVNNRVQISALASGPSYTFSFPDPRWVDKTSSLPATIRVVGAYTQLGINPGRVVTSLNIWPSWSILQDLTSPTFYDRIIRFSAPIKNIEPVMQIGYVTDPAFCRRCQGTRIEYDYGVISGTYETIQNTDLLAQECVKFIFTNLGSSFKWPWLGSNLNSRIGGKANIAGLTAGSLITMDINQAFSRYQNIKQKQDQNFYFQKVTDAEFPYSLGNLQVAQAPDDPTIVIVTANVYSRSKIPVPITRIVGTPNPFSLQGSSLTFNLAP